MRMAPWKSKNGLENGKRGKSKSSFTRGPDAMPDEAAGAGNKVANTMVRGDTFMKNNKYPHTHLPLSSTPACKSGARGPARQQPKAALSQRRRPYGAHERAATRCG